MSVRHTSDILGFVCLIVLALSCTPHRSASQGADHESTKNPQRVGKPLASSTSIEWKIAEILEHVQPWLEHVYPWPDYSTNYTMASWDGLVAAASVIQSGNPELVDEALRNYQRVHQSGSRSDDSKLLLLMRVVFDLPETESRDNWVGFGGWRDFSDINVRNTNMSATWPMKWNNGKPKLIVGFTAFQGKRYDAAAEYRYFRSKYPMRNLNSFSK